MQSSLRSTVLTPNLPRTIVPSCIQDVANCARKVLLGWLALMITIKSSRYSNTNLPNLTFVFRSVNSTPTTKHCLREAVSIRARRLWRISSLSMRFVFLSQIPLF